LNLVNDNLSYRITVSDSSLTLPSYAKINWGLRIIGKRPDGFHEVNTTLQTVSLHDDLMFSLRDDDELVLQCDVASIPTDATNLIIRAAAALNNRAKVRLGADISLTKRIPAKGGLGGASSNAALTLLALNQLWQLELDGSELNRIARELGSDVPFFLIGGSALGSGTGAEISTLPDVTKAYLIIITPNAEVSTAAAYAALNAASLTTQRSVSILSSSFAEPGFSDCDPSALNNDFEGVIFEIEPEIRRAKLALLESGAQGGLLAGSGSSVFGIFANVGERERALAALKCEQGWRVFSCETISRNEYSKSLIHLGSRYLRSLNFQTDTGA
jgi:4-diphosphocytidyl-2-C-methyl-D-erythritol kinase